MTTAAATSKRRPTARRGSAAPTAEPLAELKHYTPEEVYEMRLLPIKPRTLRDKATARQIPHSHAGGRISFTLRHIREIAAMYEVRPIGETKPAA
ncbi:hypothetical protein [Streptomyces lydicus]|uniref:hypothetical protein n=1 Tax=Streptomyces lydicus TaxID=47763 RepID=UPI0010119F40|nr:hypothetical protein [Streptomyces lydicus]MCZ1006388.1 hypothetical protein [Streptomyces lydicus]